MRHQDKLEGNCDFPGNNTVWTIFLEFFLILLGYFMLMCFGGHFGLEFQTSEFGLQISDIKSLH